MLRTINPIRKALLKKNLTEHPERSIEKNMIAAGYKPTTANRSGTNISVKVFQSEILAEINRPELIKKAYATLTRNLVCEENRNVEVSAAQSILRFTEGDRLLSVNITLDEQRKLVRDSLQELTEVKLT